MQPRDFSRGDLRSLADTELRQHVFFEDEAIMGEGGWLALRFDVLGQEQVC